MEDAVATLGAVAAPKAFPPGWRAKGDFARQPDRAIGVGATDRHRVAVLVLGFQVVAKGHRSLWILLATLGTAPFGPSSLIVVAVGVQDVAKRTKRMSMLIVSTRQLGVGVTVRLVGADINHAQSTSLPDCVQTGLFTSPSVGQDFSDPEPGESGLEIGKVVREEGRIAARGGAKNGWQCPVGGKPVVQELTGVTVIAIDHSANTGTLFPSFDGRVGTCLGSLVVARIDDESCLGISGCCVVTDVSAFLITALTSSLPFLSRRTGTGRR